MKKMKLTYVLITVIAFCSCKKEANLTPLVEKELMVSAFVGAGGSAYKDGVGEGTGFNRPNSIVTDNSGNLFVVDQGNSKIRKVTPEGVVTTLNLTGDNVLFNSNSEIAIDDKNNLYLTDQQNYRICKITPTGLVTAFAGAPERPTTIDGPIASAGIEFSGSVDITVDGSNNIYFLDKKGLRKIGTNGIVSTVVTAGTSNILGPIATASITNPQDICADKDGNVYVSSYRNSNLVILKIGTNGIVSGYAGSLNGEEGYQLGLAETAKFLRTLSMATDKSGNVYVLDNNHVITKITTDGFVRFVAGTQYVASPKPFVPGPASKAVFFDNIDITVDLNGIIYAVEYSGSSIRKISLVDKQTTPLTQTEIDKANWNKPTGWK